MTVSKNFSEVTSAIFANYDKNKRSRNHFCEADNQVLIETIFKRDFELIC